jgi:hypothetical protein
MTYPIPHSAWRRNPTRSHPFRLSPSETEALFKEVESLPNLHPNDCLPNNVLWSDTSEKANGVTRHSRNDKVCHSVGVSNGLGKWLVYFALEEDSPVLLASKLYQTVVRLASPYEELPQNPPAASKNLP